MLRRFIITTAIIAISVPSIVMAAQTGDEPEAYFAIRGFGSQHRDSDNGTRTIEYNMGGGMSAALGYDPKGSHDLWGNTRFEVEGMYRWNDIDNIRTSTAIFKGDGHYDTAAIMFNMMYPFAFKGNWKPYIGAGVGIAYASAEYTDPVSALKQDEHEFVPAAQAKIGLQYRFESNPNMYYTVGYRYFIADSLTVGGGSLDNDSHDVEMGLLTYF